MTFHVCEVVRVVCTLDVASPTLHFLQIAAKHSCLQQSLGAVTTAFLHQVSSPFSRVFFPPPLCIFPHKAQSNAQLSTQAPAETGQKRSRDETRFQYGKPSFLGDKADGDVCCEFEGVTPSPVVHVMPNHPDFRQITRCIAPV